MLDNIRIGGIHYTVAIKDTFEMTDTEKQEYIKQGVEPETLTKWGEVEYKDNEIRIWSGLSQQKKEQTVIHEMLHAIQHEAGIEEQNEDEVNRVSIILHQVLKDNDFSWLRGINNLDVLGDGHKEESTLERLRRNGFKV